MAWNVPRDPRQYAAALAWFRARVPMTAEQFDELSAKAKAQAFTLASAQQLSVVQTALDEMTRSIKEGTDFATFRQALSEKLGADFASADSPRLKAAFTTHTQRALNAGRWAQLQSPESAERQPYVVYDAVLDARTTPLCKSLHGTVLPRDHSMLQRFWPPLHWNCRTGVRGISESTARRRGITTRFSTKTKPQPGFGAPPDDVEEWAPDAVDYDSGAWRVFKQRTARRKAKDRLEAALVELGFNAGEMAAKKGKRSAFADDAHPRVPSGSPHGGEFTSKGGAASGVPAAKKKPGRARKAKAAPAETTGPTPSAPTAASGSVAHHVAAMSTGISSVVEDVGNLPDNAGAPARSAIKAYLGEHFGTQPQAGSRSERLVIAPADPSNPQHLPANILGAHSRRDGGNIRVQKHVAEQARAALESAHKGESVKPEHEQALSALVHETIHGHGPAMTHPDSDAIEEIVTETLARAATAKLMGRTPKDEPADHLGFPTHNGQRFEGLEASPKNRPYDEWIANTLSIVQKHTGWTPDKVKQELVEAAIRMKSQSATLNNEGEAPALFLSQFHGVPEADRERFKRDAGAELRKVRVWHYFN